jgi:hypothetical protein
MKMIWLAFYGSVTGGEEIAMLPFVTAVIISPLPSAPYAICPAMGLTFHQPF